MPRNTLTDLNNHLFAQLERLNDEELKGEKLQEEISRAKAVSNIAAQIINNGSLVLRSQEFIHEHGLFERNGPNGEGRSIGSGGDGASKKLPPMLRAEFLGE